MKLILALALSAMASGLSIDTGMGGVRLGDTLSDVLRAYPPRGEWTPTREEKSGVDRYRLDNRNTMRFPRTAQLMFLGFKKDHLIEIQVVYDQRSSRRKPIDVVANDFTQLYGQPNRSADIYWWADSKTILRVFPFEVPSPEDGPHAVAWRVSAQIFSRKLIKK